MADGDNLSGKAWFDKNQKTYPYSKDLADLKGSFKTAMKSFSDALSAAKATINVATTYRHPTRAFLMYYSWRVAKGQTKAANVPTSAGLDIKWDHGDDKKSQKAAQEMVGAFGIVYPPALKSNHELGFAIDMAISWKGELKIKDAKGKEVVIKSSPRNGQNKELHAVGKSYGVIKLVSDKPHWSTDGK